MKLELAILAGAESKAFLANLTQQIDRLEALSKGVTITSATTKKTAPADEDLGGGPANDYQTDDEDFAPKKKTAKKTAPAFEDDEETATASAASTDDDEDFSAPKKTAAPKKKKLTDVDVNNACKAAAQKSSVKEVRALLKKKFKVESIQELSADQYEAVITAVTELGEE